MAVRGIELFQRSAVPVRTREDPVRNEERFRAQVIDMFRERDREIEDLRREIAELRAEVDAL